MSDLLKAVRNVHKSSEEVPDAILTEISTQPGPPRSEHLKVNAGRKVDDRDTVESNQPLIHDSTKESHTLEEILAILKTDPSVANLVQLLNRINQAEQRKESRLHSPGPTQARIINVLVNTTLPTFWPVLGQNEKDMLVACLRCLAGIQAIIARLKLILSQTAKDSIQNNVEILRTFLAVTHVLLKGDSTLLDLWRDLGRNALSDVKRDLTWKELINIIASGKVIAVVAQAEDALKMSELAFKPSWLSRGSDYATWLGRNVTTMLQSRDDPPTASSSSVKAAAQAINKSLSLGYPLPFTEGFMTLFLNQVSDGRATPKSIRELLKELKISSQKQLLEHTLRWLSYILQSNESFISEQLGNPDAEVSGVAALLSVLVHNMASMTALLSTFMTDPPFLSSLNLTVRRAMIAVLIAQAPDDFDTILEKAITQFGDRLFIQHVPIIQQESLAQVLLLAAGYIHRRNPTAVLVFARSSGHLQGVSNRLDSSNQRSRWLGMVVGTALSGLVDKEGSRMSFGTAETDTNESKWFLRLVTVNDDIGTLAQLQNVIQSQKKVQRQTTKSTKLPEVKELPIIDGKRVFGPPRPPAMVQTEIRGERVTEILDDEEDADKSDVDLQPYAKPDSDPEDSDEDATLVNRNKTRAPVYIRDLLKMLRDDKDHDRFQLSIRHAATLIRRKAHFGSEVKDHAEELAGMLCNLQDPFDTESFDELRLQALIAVFLTDVKALAPFLCKQAFEGDYSLSQRCIILSALGLGGRELAGLEDEDDLNPSLLEDSSTFPSKRLPARLHAIYSPGNPSVRRLEAARKHAEHQLIQPLALSAADQATSHLNPVKIRTFSSRMAVAAAGRTRRAPARNRLSPIFAQAFLFPLVHRYQRELAAYGASSVFASASVVLVTFLKTIALLLHAAGPATLALPELTPVFWDLLLSLRVAAVADISVREAVLFALLTLLDVNADAKQRLAQETPKQLVETQRWVELVFERTGGGALVTEGSGEETRVRTLAAGVLVRTKEVVDAYQKLLIGNVPEF